MIIRMIGLILQRQIRLIINPGRNSQNLYYESLIKYFPFVVYAEYTRPGYSDIEGYLRKQESSF